MRLQRSARLLPSIALLFVLAFPARSQAETELGVVGPTGADTRSISGPGALVDHPPDEAARPQPAESISGPPADPPDGGSDADAEAVILTLVNVLAPAADDGEASWETYQGDERHSGYVPVVLEPAMFELRWQREVAPGVTLNPVTAADGKVFVSTYVYFNGGEALFVLDARDGEKLWSRGFGQPFSVNPPAYGHGNVYIQTGNHGGDTYLWAFDAESGAQVFKSPHSAQWERYFAPTLYDGGVYVNGGYYGGTYAFDALSGNQRWFTGLPQYDEYTPAVDQQSVYAYVGENAPALYVLDRATGLLAYRIPDPNFEWNGWSMDLAPVLGGQGDVVVIHDGRLIKFDLSSRAIGYEIDSNFTGQPSVAKGVIYAINSGSVEARSESNGSLLWRWTPVGGAASEHLIVTDSHVLAHTGTTTHALEIDSGQSEWSYPVAGHMALGDDMLYIASGATVTAISMPGFDVAPPLRLEITGPAAASENGTTAYVANVHYADGRVRNRSKLSTWSVDPVDAATIDADGLMAVGELLTPSESVVVRARYEENGVVFTAALPVELQIAVTLDAFVARNVAAAVAAEERARDELHEALVHESAAIAVASEEARRTRRSGGIWKQLLLQLRRATSATQSADRAAERSIDTLEGR